MDVSLIRINLLSPPLLFFLLGLTAAFLKTDLDIPRPVTKFLSLYLLFAIGFHGGVQLSSSPFSSSIGLALGAAILAACLVPLYTFFLMRRRLNVYDAAAVAATNGSISAITTITCISLLRALRIPFGGHMIAAMALMEAPAIVVGALLVRWYSDSENHGNTSELFREAFLNGSIVLLIGSLIVGLISGQPGMAALKPFSEDIFKGMVSFFLLDMGLLSGKRLHSLRDAGSFVIGSAIIIPLINSVFALGVARLIGMGVGDGVLFITLCASSSYIAVPAAMRLIIPQANPSLYIPMAIGITFPFNISLGLPLYLFLAKTFLG